MTPIRIAANVKLTTKYGHYQADIYLSSYQHDDSTALFATEAGCINIPLLALTKNLCDYDMNAPDGFVWIPDYSQYKGIYDCLVDLGIVKSTDTTYMVPETGATFFLTELLKKEEV